MSKYKITYYTHPGTVLTRQQIQVTTLSRAESQAMYVYSHHREHGPVHVWHKDRMGEWEIIATDDDIERLV